MQGLFVIIFFRVKIKGAETTMKYNFTKIIDRKGKDAIAIDMVGKGGFAPDGPKEGWDIIPMWIADMNFETVPTIPEAIFRAKRGLSVVASIAPDIAPAAAFMRMLFKSPPVTAAETAPTIPPTNAPIAHRGKVPLVSRKTAGLLLQ